MTDPRKTARNHLGRHTITLDLLWLTYWGEGGAAPLFEFDAYIHEALKPPAFELRILTWAMEDLNINPW